MTHLLRGSRGASTDAALAPDPEALVSRFPEEFENYLYCVLLDLQSAAEQKKSTPPRRSAPETERGKARDGRRAAITRVRARLASHPHAVAGVRGPKRLETRR